MRNAKEFTKDFIARLEAGEFDNDFLAWLESEVGKYDQRKRPKGKPVDSLDFLKTIMGFQKKEPGWDVL